MGPRAERDRLAIHAGGRIRRPAVSDLVTEMPDGVIVRTGRPVGCRLRERACIERDILRVSDWRIVGRALLHFVRTDKDRLKQAELKSPARAAALEDRFRLSVLRVPDSGDVASDRPIARAAGLLGVDAEIRIVGEKIELVAQRLNDGAGKVLRSGRRQVVKRLIQSGERTAVQTARRDVPRKLARIIERAIDPRPERRYESADALAADLAALKPRPRIVRLAYAAGVAAAFILVVGVGWEVAGRQVGSSRTPSALLAGFAGLGPVGAVNVSPAERPVIAVLPLTNLSAEPDSEYFVDGLTDEIIRNLAVIQGLQVRSRTSSFAFKDKPRDLRNIGEQLGANLVLEGSVLRAGNRVRINAQLVQVAGDIPLWADRFDRDLKDIFAIQDEISRAIVNKLRLTLGKGQRRYDTNLEAYELYLKARALVDRRGVVNAQTAAKLFGQVIAKDSAFAPAHAGLANAYAFMSTPYGGIPFETAYPIMRPAAVKALQLDPLLAEAHAAMGWVYSYERDWANAEKAFQRAIELTPSLTQTYTSYSISTLEPLGKHDDALRLLQTASRHDPLSLNVQREIGRVQFSAGRYQEAIETLRPVYAIDPDFPFVTMYLARSLMMAGRLLEVSSLENTDRMAMALVYVRTGQRAEAQKLVAVMGNPYTEAVVYAVMADEERTFGALERVANSAPQRLGRLLMTPELRVLRGDPRVVALRKKFGLP